MKLHGLIIDPQIDFCDPEGGTLYVPGAERDMERLAGMVRALGPTIAHLHVTLDSHHHVDIAHPVWWVDADGARPAPFTIITLSDVDAGRWRTTLPERQVRSREYVAALERDGRYPLCVWPYHCLIGSRGQNVVPALLDALEAWEDATGTATDFVTKGDNIWTEHYSAIKAEVPDPADPSTRVNRGLLERLREADLIFVAGEAGSHCLANTVRDLVAEMGASERILERLVLLTDATSPVTGFESLQDDFVRELTARGMRTETTASFTQRVAAGAGTIPTKP